MNTDTEKKPAVAPSALTDVLCRKCGSSDLKTKYIAGNETVNTSSLDNVNNEFIYSIEYEIYFKLKAKKEHLQIKCVNCGHEWRDNVRHNVEVSRNQQRPQHDE